MIQDVLVQDPVIFTIYFFYFLTQKITQAQVFISSNLAFLSRVEFIGFPKAANQMFFSNNGWIAGFNSRIIV